VRPKKTVATTGIVAVCIAAFAVIALALGPGAVVGSSATAGFGGAFGAC